jgi:hypothetical protein
MDDFKYLFFVGCRRINGEGLSACTNQPSIPVLSFILKGLEFNLKEEIPFVAVVSTKNRDVLPLPVE